MFNRLPDRGPDAARQVGSLQDMGAALGFMRGNSGMERNPERNRADFTVKVDSGFAPYNETFYPGEGHVQIAGADENTFDMRGTAGIENKNPRIDEFENGRRIFLDRGSVAREGDGLN